MLVHLRRRLGDAEVFRDLRDRSTVLTGQVHRAAMIDLRHGGVMT